MNNHLIDCNSEYKRLRQLQYNCEWEDKYEDAKDINCKQYITRNCLIKVFFMKQNFKLILTDQEK